MLDLPEIMPIETVLAMAKIPFDTAKTTETPELQPRKSGAAFAKIQRQRYSSGQAKPYTSSPRSKKTTHVQKTNRNNDETSGIKIRLINWKTDQANVKVMVSRGGNAERPPCSEPNLFKDACTLMEFSAIARWQTAQPPALSSTAHPHHQSPNVPAVQTPRSSFAAASNSTSGDSRFSHENILLFVEFPQAGAQTQFDAFIASREQMSPEVLHRIRNAFQTAIAANPEHAAFMSPQPVNLRAEHRCFLFELLHSAHKTFYPLNSVLATRYLFNPTSSPISDSIREVFRVRL